MSPNDADRMANSVDPEEQFDWVYKVCPGPFVRKLRIITVCYEHFFHMSSRVSLRDKLVNASHTDGGVVWRQWVSLQFISDM